MLLLAIFLPNWVYWLISFGFGIPGLVMTVIFFIVNSSILQIRISKLWNENSIVPLRERLILSGYGLAIGATILIPVLATEFILQRIAGSEDKLAVAVSCIVIFLIGLLGWQTQHWRETLLLRLLGIPPQTLDAVKV